MMTTLFLKEIDSWMGSFLIHLLSHPVGENHSLPPTPRFLFIRPGGIGDAVLLIPTIRAIKAAYPDSTIEILAETRNGAIFKLCPAVDKVYKYDRGSDFFSCLVKRYDCVIDTEQHHKLSAVTTRCIRSKIRIGFSGNARDKMFSECVEYSQDSYEIDSFLKLLAPLGIASPVQSESTFLHIPETVRHNVLPLLKTLSAESFVAIFPGASIQARQWGADKYHKLTKLLNEQGLAVVVIGGKEDKKTGDKIVQGSKGLNLAGKTTLEESGAIIEQSQLLISGDSGVLHMGVGLNKVTVSLFGPGIERKWAPQGDKHIVINKHLACSPCTTFGYTPQCPDNAACMQHIQVEEVFAGAMSLIEKQLHH